MPSLAKKSLVSLSARSSSLPLETAGEGAAAGSGESAGFFWEREEEPD